MKPSKKAQSMLDKLDKRLEELSYYTNGCEEVQRDHKELRNYIISLTLHVKKDHIKIAQSVKKKFAKKD